MSDSNSLYKYSELQIEHTTSARAVAKILKRQLSSLCIHCKFNSELAPECFYKEVKHHQHQRAVAKILQKSVLTIFF